MFLNLSVACCETFVSAAEAKLNNKTVKYGFTKCGASGNPVGMLWNSP